MTQEVAAPGAHPAAAHISPISPVHLPYISRTSPLQEEVAAVRILQGLLRARGEAAYAPGAQPEEG